MINEIEFDNVPSFREMLDICEHYPDCSNKKANWYCGDCQMIICLSCKSKHKNHEILKELKE